MGTGWRRAFCTTIPRDREPQFVDKHAQDSQQEVNDGAQQIPSPGSCARLGFLSSSNPSTPRLRCKTNNKATSNDINSLISPKLHCKTTPKFNTKSPKTLLGSNPSSPRSPFSILKNTLRLSKHSCGVCSQGVKSGQGMAIYTAECSHTFHFPCIASHVRKQSTLVCPVCNSTWKDVPLLAIHKLQQQHDQKEPHKQKEQEQQESSCPNTPTIINKQQKPLPNVKTYYKKPEHYDSKAYNDDEPLLTPTAGAKFVPIPEANEDQEDDEEEEIEEFRGFFVNPISSDEAFANQRDNHRSVEVSLMPEAAIVSVGRSHETYAVVLKVKAPPPPPSPPPTCPIDLVTVLDVSGSMSGPKIQMLKRAMRLVISSLGSVDRLSIVAFSATPKRLLPLRRMTPQGQRSARRIIDRLVTSQGTCVAEALRKATKVLEERRERNPVASIMLLSDGQDEKIQGSNTQNRRSKSTHLSSTRFGHIEIPVHSSGFGEKAGYSYEPTEEDAFSKCVGGLLSVVVQDLKIQLDFSSGSDPAEVAAVYSYNGRPAVLSSSCVRLGDLYAEEERELLLEVKVPTMTNGSHHVLSIRCCYKDPATQEAIYGREHSLLVPRPQVSKRLVEHNELSGAMHLLSSARALLIQSGSAFLTEVQWRKQYQQQIEQQKMTQLQRMNEREMSVFVDENGEPLTPTSAWRAAEKLAKVAMMKKSMNRVSDLHGFENARF
ncbi:unnamed protein product [Withania somnifera]